MYNYKCAITVIKRNYNNYFKGYVVSLAVTNVFSIIVHVGNNFFSFYEIFNDKLSQLNVSFAMS